MDHDHATGEVRGTLCFNCNQALGNVRDDTDVMQLRIGSLRRHQRLVATRDASESVVERSLAAVLLI